MGLEELDIPTMKDINQQGKYKRKEATKNLCQRCRDLRFTNKLPLKEENSPETLLAPFVNDFNRKELLRALFSRIYPRSIIIYVTDMSNFEGSLVPEILTEVENKKHRMIFVGNKIDALPSGFTIDRLQLWVKNQLKERMNEEALKQTTICLSSAKKSTGISKIMTVLDKIKGSMQHLPHLPKVYVLGTTNSGKSSLLNAMLQKQTKYETNKTKEPPLLTESALPGTTQEMITVEQFNIGFRVIDTPGIPNMNQVSARVQQFYDLKKLMPLSEMTTYPVNVKQGYSLWLGALARLDLLSGEDKYLTVIVPKDVTIHRTPIERASEIFKNQAGKLLKPSYLGDSSD